MEDYFDHLKRSLDDAANADQTKEIGANAMEVFGCKSVAENALKEFKTEDEN